MVYILSGVISSFDSSQGCRKKLSPLVNLMKQFEVDKSAMVLHAKKVQRNIILPLRVNGVYSAFITVLLTEESQHNYIHPHADQYDSLS